MTTDAVSVGGQTPRKLPAVTRNRAVGALLVIGLIALYWQAWVKTECSVSSLIDGYHGMVDILSRAWPPDLSVLRPAISGSVVTFDTALLGTTVAIGLTFLVTPFAARNISPHRITYEIARLVIAVTRAIPDLIFALIFVTAVGLGPFPGVLALSVHTVGVLGKLWAEAIEDMDMGPVDALKVAGAGRLQVFLHAVLPGVAPTMVGLAIYRFDVNFRSSLVLGFVGAGGIGFQIYNSMQLFQYQQVTTQLLVVLAAVLLVERASTVIRGRIV